MCQQRAKGVKCPKRDKNTSMSASEHGLGCLQRVTECTLLTELEKASDHI